MVVELRTVPLPVSIYDTVSDLMIVQVYELLRLLVESFAQRNVLTFRRTYDIKIIGKQHEHLFISLFQMKIWTVRMPIYPSSSSMNP